MTQKHYLLTVHVIQSGEDISDAKKTLSNNLGTVLDEQDFEVSPIGVEIHQNSSMLIAQK